MPVFATLLMPDEPESPNIRALSALAVERYTGSTATTFTLTDTAIEGMEQVFKNGTLLDPGNPGAAGTYLLKQNTLTLGTALLVTDVLIVRYYYRVAR